MDLKDLVVYQLAMELANDIYSIASKWQYFDRDTVGKQIVRACDSIAANISEGYGRFSYKENKLFCYYSHG